MKLLNPTHFCLQPTQLPVCPCETEVSAMALQVCALGGPPCHLAGRHGNMGRAERPRVQIPSPPLSGSSITCPKLNNHLMFPPKPAPPLLTSSPQFSSSFTSLQPHCPPLNTADSHPRTFAPASPSTWKCFFLRHTHGWLSHLLQVFTQCHHVNEAKPGHHPRSHPSPAVFPQQLPLSTTLCDFDLFRVYHLPSSIRIKVAQAMVESW